MYQERFKSNTRNDLEELYSPEKVLSMEADLKKDTDKYDDLLEQSGCFKEDPHEGQISSFALWTNKDPAAEACDKLFVERKEIAEGYQGKVRSMLLSKDYNRFITSLNTLYTVSKSLHLRLKAQGCQGEKPLVSESGVRPVIEAAKEDEAHTPGSNTGGKNVDPTVERHENGEKVQTAN